MHHLHGDGIWFVVLIVLMIAVVALGYRSRS